MRDDTTCLVEEGRIHMTLHRTAPEQLSLLHVHLGQHGGFVPGIQTVCQHLVACSHRPLHLERVNACAAIDDGLWGVQVFGQRKHDDVALAVEQSFDHFHGVTTQFHPHRHTHFLGKTFTQQILRAHAPAVVVVIGGRPRHGQRNEFAIAHDVAHGKTRVSGYGVGHHLSPGSHYPLVFAVGARQPETNDQHQHDNMLEMIFHPFFLYWLQKYDISCKYHIKSVILPTKFLFTVLMRK